MAAWDQEWIEAKQTADGACLRELLQDVQVGDDTHEIAYGTVLIHGTTTRVGNFQELRACGRLSCSEVCSVTVSDSIVVPEAYHPKPPRPLVDSSGVMATVPEDYCVEKRGPSLESKTQKLLGWLGSHPLSHHS